MEEDAKRQAEVPLEDLDPAMILSGDTPGGLGRAVGALEVIEEAENSDPEEDDESDYVAGGDLEREEGSHRGRLEELKKMQEFKLYDVVSSLPITNRIVDAVAESHGWARLGCDECVLSCCRGRGHLWRVSPRVQGSTDS